MCTPHACHDPESEEGIGFSRTLGSFQPPWWYWESNLGLLQDTSALNCWAIFPHTSPSPYFNQENNFTHKYCRKERSETTVYSCPLYCHSGRTSSVTVVTNNAYFACKVHANYTKYSEIEDWPPKLFSNFNFYTCDIAGMCQHWHTIARAHITHKYANAHSHARAHTHETHGTFTSFIKTYCAQENIKYRAVLVLKY